MATVPYTGVPSVAPQDTPIGRDQVQATPDMFGANIGQALQHLGATSDAVGNEIFARGMAMQDLYNHSQAQQGVTDYMQAAGDIHEKLKSLQGDQAVDYYQNGFKQDLQDARQKIRDSLPNGMAQKLYDSESLSTLGRTMFNGAGLAGEQNRQYAINASNARIAALKDQTLKNAADDDAFQDNMQDTEDEIRQSAPLVKGQAPEVIDQQVAVAKSNLWAERIKGLAKTEPFRAGKLLQQATNDGEVQGEQLGQLNNLVQSAQNTIGARIVSQQVSTGAGNRYGTGPVDIEQARMAISTIETGSAAGNYAAQTDTGSKHGVALGRYQVMSGYLPEFLKEAGMPSMTSAEFLANHAAQDQLFATRFSALMKETGSANGAAARWIGTKGADAFGTDANKYVGNFNAALAKNASLSQRQALGSQIAQEQGVGNPIFPDVVRDRIDADHSKDIVERRDDLYQTEQPIESALVGAMSQDGKIPTSPEELTAIDPKVAAAWEKLGAQYPAKQRYYLNVMANHAKGDHALTPETLRQYTGFTGEAISRPADFVNEDILGTNLPIAKKAELIKLQQSIQGKTDKGNPAVQQAIHDSATEIRAASVDPKNKDDFDQFTGALADQLRQFSLDNKKPPSYEDRKTIVSRVLQNHAVPGMFYGTNQVPLYQVSVPSDVAAEAKRLDPTLTDAEIQRRYTAKLYTNTFGGSKKQPAAPGPQASISK